MHVIWWLYFALNIAKDNSGYERSASPRPGGSGMSQNRTQTTTTTIASLSRWALNSASQSQPGTSQGTVIQPGTPNRPSIAAGTNWHIHTYAK